MYNWWKGFLKHPLCRPPAQVQARALLEMIVRNALKLLKVRMDELRNLIDQTGKRQSITSTYEAVENIL